MADGSVERNGNRNEYAPSRRRMSQDMLMTIEESLFEPNLDDVFYFCIAFLSILIVPLAIMGGGAPYHDLTVNIRPVSESILEDLDCDDLNITAVESGEGVCSMDTFLTRYSLFHRQVNYFHFTPTFGVSMCEDDNNAFKFLEKFTSNSQPGSFPEDTESLLGGGNIGQCTQAQMFTAAAFAFLTMICALAGVFWLTVVSSEFEPRKAAKIHMVFSFLTMTFSAITIAIFSVYVNPLRDDIGPTFCDEQTAFEDCEGKVGFGFYCQLSVAISSCIVCIIHVFQARVDASEITLSCCTKKKDVKMSRTEQIRRSLMEHRRESLILHDHPSFYKNPHFYIKLGRFSEFILAIISAMTNWTILELLLPDIDETPISMSSYLWGNQFCADSLFATDEFLLTQENAALNNYGDCYSLYKYKVIFTLVKIVVTAGSALFLKRDAAKNPFMFLGGLVADMASFVLAMMAIIIFMTKIYPGRSGIEPPFCEEYVAMRNSYLEIEGVDVESSDNGEICDIRLGHGFYVLCAVLVLTIVNLVAEFIAGEIGSEYGAFNAFETVMSRVRQKEYKDAILGSSSFYRRKTGAMRSHRSKLLDIVFESEEMEKSDSNPRQMMRNEKFDGIEPTEEEDSDSNRQQNSRNVSFDVIESTELKDPDSIPRQNSRNVPFDVIEPTEQIILDSGPRQESRIVSFQE